MWGIGEGGGVAGAYRGRSGEWGRSGHSGG